MTIDDPKAFTRPFSFKIDKTFAADTELLESVCENDRSVPHMLGGMRRPKLAPEILSKYVGTYEFAPGTRRRDHHRERSCCSCSEGANPLKLPLVATSEARFVSRTNGDWVEFTSDAQGVTGFTYHTGDAERKAIRK